MKLFISWSGELSHSVAIHLRDWLPVVLPFTDPWVSSEDIPKGHRWGTELAAQLAGTHSGIVCVVPGNLNEPWLNFEAGALSKSVERARVHPFLLGVQPRDLTGPLSQFQATRFDKDDVRKLVKAINAEAGADALASDKAGHNFERWWPDLERHLTPLLAEASAAKQQAAGAPERTSAADEALTEEDIALLRLLSDAGEAGLYLHDASGSLGLNPSRVHYLMERLEEMDLLEAAQNALDETSWYLSRAGRALLVKRGLL